MASFVCEKQISGELNHKPLLSDPKIDKFLLSRVWENVPSYHWCNIETFYFYSFTLTEDGLCFTFNPVSASSIFRKDTVDPAFIKQYEPESWGTDTTNWNMENGYNLKTMKNYPLRSLDKGKENGFRFDFKKTDLADVDTACRKDPLDVKVAVHHPAEVVSNRNSFVTVPFNKSFTFLVRPSITRSSESLRSYDPAV
jgi:amiloride-sensitive sodium channel